MAADRVGLLLMTYGSPESIADVEAYLTNIRRGRQPDPALVEDFKERYRVIGGSPLVEITRRQAATVARRLSEDDADGRTFVPYVGMRYWRPFVQDAVSQMVADGLREAVGLIMSPQYSPLLMRGYLEAIAAAVDEADGGIEITVVESWWEDPLYHRAIARRIEDVLLALPSDVRESVPLLLTAHSLPRSVYDRDPAYVAALKQTAECLTRHFDHPWQFAYQSAGHTQEEWLRPDMVDLFPDFARQGHEYVVVAPFQFLCDHLELLYDIDVAARTQALEHGLRLQRIEAPNTSPIFIEAMVTVLKRALPPVTSSPRRGAGGR